MIQPYTLGPVDEQSDDSPINTTIDLHASDKDMSHRYQTAPPVHSRQTKTHGTYLRILRPLLSITPTAYKNHTKPTSRHIHHRTLKLSNTTCPTAPPRHRAMPRSYHNFPSHYEKTAVPICMKFSGKVWTDHGTT